MLENCKNTVINLVTRVKFLDLVKACKEGDPLADPMKVSQLISDLVAEKKIPPVFYHPVTKQYKELPIHYQKQLYEVAPENFRRLYSKIKKNHSSKVAYQYQKLEGLSKQGLAMSIDQPIGVIKEVIPVKISFWKRLFGHLREK